jgi:molybdopterin synthase catalytic subunit
MTNIKIQPEPLDVQACINWVMSPESGGIDVFIGTVRNSSIQKNVLYLEFEAYSQMAVSELTKIAEYINGVWSVHKILMHHRTGILQVGEIPVIIAVSAAHRDAAFSACRYAIDKLKQTVPIWKKEVFENGDVRVATHP